MEQNIRRTPSRDQMNQSTPGNWSRKNPRWKSSEVTDNQCDNAPRKHGYSSFHRARRTTDLHPAPAQDGCMPEQPGKASKPSVEPASQEKRFIRGSSDVTKTGYRGTRPSPNSAEKTKAGQMNAGTFEVKMSDFPELGNVSPSVSTPIAEVLRMRWGLLAPPSAERPPSPATASARWGVSAPSSADRAPPSPSTTTKNVSAAKGRSRTDSRQRFFSRENCDVPLTITQGQPTEAILPPATSWANVASQPPKKAMPKNAASPSAPSQEDPSSQPVEQVSDKKRRKKKKKSKTLCEDNDVQTPDDLFIQQEPPKFEDEEEFPDLSLSFVGPHRTSAPPRPGREDKGLATSQKEGTALPPQEKAKDKTVGKSGPADPKKAQKPEKTSQKKSKVPVQLDLGNMLAALQQKQQAQKSKQDLKPVTLSVGGAIHVVHKEPSAQKKHPWQQEKIAHNPLDSTSPLVKKGKQREVPKAKKPTPLKRVILKEREERKQNRLLEERGLAPETHQANGTDHAVNEEEMCETDLSEHDQQDPTANDEGSCLAVTVEPEVDQPDSDQVDGVTEDGVVENAAPKTCTPNPNRPKIHSRKFRDYCSQVLSKDVDECVTSLLKELVRFQDRLYQKDPMKARMKRRLVMGLREVLKHLKLRKLKCVVISPNCERIQSKGGLDEALHTIIDTCREQAVPFVFGLSRKALGRCVNKAVPVSLVGIFNYDGAQDHYHKMIELSSEARTAYEVMIANLEVASEEQQECPPDEQNIEPTLDPPVTEEPEYIKIWKKMLEKECNHQFLNFEEQFASVAMAADSEQLLDDDEGS